MYKFKKILIFSLVIITFSNCALRVSDKVDRTIHIEKSICLGLCPAYNVSIHPNGKIIFKGIKNTKHIGTITDTLKKKDLNGIHLAFREANFQKLKSKFDPNIYDFPITTITFGNKKIELKKYVNIPVELKNFLVQVEKILKSKNWIN